MDTTVAGVTEVPSDLEARGTFAFLEALEDSEAIALELFLFFGNSASAAAPVLPMIVTIFHLS